MIEIEYEDKKGKTNIIKKDDIDSVIDILQNLKQNNTLAIVANSDTQRIIGRIEFIDEDLIWWFWTKYEFHCSNQYKHHSSIMHMHNRRNA